jgi:anthranilate synthase
MPSLSYTTASGINVTRSASGIPFKKGLEHLLHKLDRYRGIYLSSGYEYPERYSRWDVASICPPLEIVAAGQEIEFRALNKRGEVLNRLLFPLFEHHPHWEEFGFRDSNLHGRLKPLPKLFPEEERSKQPSAFSILRTLIEDFRGTEDARLALLGAFGYDLLFQFDPIRLKLPRERQKDLHLFLCDDIYYMDRKKEQIERYRYDFAREGISTAGLERSGTPIPRAPKRKPGEITSDHKPQEYMAMVETVREGMRQGEYYEVVLRQTFAANFSESPSKLFQRIQLASPSPYEFFLQMGDEQLVGA